MRKHLPLAGPASGTPAPVVSAGPAALEPHASPLTDPRPGVRTYYLEWFGCQMNEHDAERMAGLLEVAGYRRVADPGEADLAVLNTCAIRENADNKLYGHLGALKQVKDRTGLRIAVGGCLAEMDRERVVERAPWVDVVFGTRNIDSLPRLVAAVEHAGVPIVEFAEQFTEFPSALPSRRESAFHAWVAIQFGCNNACTFCIVPSVRGREVSRSIGDIVGEVTSLAESGVTEVSLLGQNVNSYGRDLVGRPIFSDLLRAVDRIGAIRRIRYTSPHPKDFKQDTALAMAECEAVCEHLHLPVQSGSDAVLRRMKRAYSRRTYLEKVDMARRIIPGLAITTDIIVGFPGETDADFEDTLSLVEQVGFDSAYMFQYSVRPGTSAATMDEQVPKAVVQERFDRLVALQTDTSAARNAELVGRIVEVTVERESSKTDASRSTGRTRTNKLVHVQDASVPAGGQGRVLVTGSTPHYLLGRPA